MQKVKYLKPLEDFFFCRSYLSFKHIFKEPRTVILRTGRTVEYTDEL